MEIDKLKVLYIDDEVANLNSFKATFRKDYQVYLANNTQEALVILSQTEVQVIVADQRMPGQTGVEFFESIKSVYPDPIRVLLTGYADLGVVINAINKGQVFRFIDKPWDESAVIEALQNSKELYQTRQELKQKSEQLSRALLELDKFVYSVSHDVRAPMMAILGLIQLAKSEFENAKQNQEASDQMLEIFNYIETSIDRLDSFLKNLLQYFQNKKEGTTPSELDLERIVHEVLAPYFSNPLFREIKTEISLNLAHTYVSDEERIRIVLNNLISNAFVFQQHDNPEKRVSLRIQTNQEGLEIDVEDNGIGISEEIKDRVFEMFFRGTTLSQGAGVGLYLVKEAVEKLSGTIDFQSNTERGTRIHVFLPKLVGK